MDRMKFKSRSNTWIRWLSQYIWLSYSANPRGTLNSPSSSSSYAYDCPHIPLPLYREVEVVRLVGKDTIEEEILKCAQQKLKLEQDMTSGSMYIIEP